MAKTLQSAAANYDRKIPTMIQNYGASGQYAVRDWQEGETEFLGRAPRPERTQAYAESWNTNPTAYAESMRKTSGSKWARGMQDKM